MDSILLSDLQDLLKNKTKYLLSEQQGHQGVHSGDGNQGEYNETIKYYQHPGLPEGIFMQEVYQSDSYGDNYGITSVSFVKGKAKTITVYEPV